MIDTSAVIEKGTKRKDAYAILSKLALSLLEKNEMWSPSHIHIGRIARSVGIDLRFTATGSSDARTVRADPHAWISVDERVRGAPRARYSTAHELCHCLCHPDQNAIERIHGQGPKSGWDFHIEDHANWFASNILMPGPMFVPYCTDLRPTLREIDRVGSVFGTSRQATAKRYATFATSPCAVVECKNGIIKYVTKSPSFRGIAVQKRLLEESTLAAAINRGEPVPESPRRVARGTWGSAKLDVEMIEQASFIRESGIVLVWLWHGAA